MPVFGLPLREVAKCASTSALFNGHELHLPLVVFDCVEELYRTGKQSIVYFATGSLKLSTTRHLSTGPVQGIAQSPAAGRAYPHIQLAQSTS